MQDLRIDPLSGLRVAIGVPDPAGPEAPGETVTVADDPLAGGRGQPEMFAAQARNGTIETIDSVPGTARSLLQLGADGLAATMSLWRERMRAHTDAPFRHLVVDEGLAAGAESEGSRAHLHVLPFVPAAIARERERFTAYHDRTQGRNLLEDLLTEEVRRNERVVVVDPEAIVICPFASAFPFQLQLIPRKPAARFEDEGPLGAAALHGVLERLAAAHGALPPFNLWLRTAPSGAHSFCWRIDLLPRLAQPDGLELGAGVWRNDIWPEQAAERLRAAMDTA
jgi:UDPglucose--hexose-1-phosphate uridylyltransferase